MSYQVKKQIRNIRAIGNTPYRQVHAHSTGNRASTAQNEADYMSRKDIATGYYTHVVGNGQVIQVANVNRGAWDVGGGYNYETYAAVELIESHKSKEEFMRDYKIYVELLRDLAKEAGVSVTLDDNQLDGIKTHDWCRLNQPNNGTDHTDPYHYLAAWGINKETFKRDIANGFTSTQSVAKQPIQVSKPQPKSTASKTSKTSDKFIAEKGTYIMNVATNLRTGTSTRNKIIAKLPVSSAVKYDAFIIKNGYLWIRQPREDGYAYLATGPAKNGKRTDKAWGVFK